MVVSMVDQKVVVLEGDLVALLAARLAVSLVACLAVVLGCVKVV